ncbi:MAG: UbiA prenyltransferase [Ignavibacteria bacterium]|nr:UbiA prenyltransferase [Ignavibacteria bacterium]
MEENKNRNIPLCVDLDGTLIATDTLYESALLLLKKSPLTALQLPFWLLGGKAKLKAHISNRVELNPATLPYKQKVLDYLANEKQSGRKLALVTASNQKIANAIAEHVGLFDEIISSTDSRNIFGKEKLNTLIETYGERGFDYVGDSSADLPAFSAARNAILVDAKASVKRKAKSNGNVSDFIDTQKSKVKVFISEIRVYQWVKNILIFIPLLLAHKLFDFALWGQAFAGFAAFCFCASSVYVLNDMLDLESDRHHPTKRNRPLASGRFSILLALFIVPLFFISGFLLSIYFLPLKFTIILAIYIIVTTAYSFHLKKIYILDIMLLAGLYTIRLLSGALAVEVEISPWLPAFSMFLFISLASIKRFTELKMLEANNKSETKGRDYLVADSFLIQNVGIISGYMAVLVFSLYINSQEVLKLYNHPKLLWGIAPLMLYWVTRIWFLANRGKMHDDPIFFTVKDPASYFIGLLILILISGAAL